MSKVRKIACLWLLIGIALAVSSCATTTQGPIQQSLRIDGNIQPNSVKITSFGDHQKVGITAYSTNFRQFGRQIQKGEKTEEVLYWEPVKWKEWNQLPVDTRKLKVSLIIENPLFKSYRLVKLTEMEGAPRKEEVLKFKNGGMESFADIQEFYDIELPVNHDKRVKFEIRLDLLEGPELIGGKSLKVSELSFNRRGQ